MKITTIILATMIIISGVYCLFTPGATFLTLGWLVGISLAVAGINAIMAYTARRKVGATTVWDLLGGILALLMGILVLANTFAQLLTDAIIIYMLATGLVLAGIFRIFASTRLKKLGLSWVWMLVMGILTVLVGLYSFFHPILTAIALGYLIGFWVIVSGINLLSIGISMNSRKAG